MGILISAHPLEDVSSDFTIKVLNLSLARVGKDGSLLNIDLKYVSTGSFFLQLHFRSHSPGALPVHSWSETVDPAATKDGGPQQ